MCGLFSFIFRIEFVTSNSREWSRLVEVSGFTFFGCFVCLFLFYRWCRKRMRFLCEVIGIWMCEI